MNAVYAALICIAGALICTVLKQTRPEMAVGVALAAGTAAILVCMEDIRRAAEAIKNLSETSGISSSYYAVMLKACGIAMISEFAAQICSDAGETSLAGRIKLALRASLIVMAIPILADVFSQSVSLLR